MANDIKILHSEIIRMYAEVDRLLSETHALNDDIIGLSNDVSRFNVRINAAEGTIADINAKVAILNNPVSQKETVGYYWITESETDVMVEVSLYVDVTETKIFNTLSVQLIDYSGRRYVINAYDLALDYLVGYIYVPRALLSTIGNEGYATFLFFYVDTNVTTGG